MALQGAVRSGNLELLAAVLAHPRFIAESGDVRVVRSGLLMAAATGNVEATGQLLAAEGLDFVDFEEVALNTLGAAALHGHAPVIECIAADARVGLEEDLPLTRVLELAAEGGSAEAVDCVLGLEGRLGFEGTAGGYQPLHNAAYHGHLRALQRLLLDARFTEGDARCAMMAAAEEGQTAVVDFLLAMGSAGDARLHWANPASFYDYRDGSDQGLAGPGQLTPCTLGSAALYVACHAGSTEVVARLLQLSLSPAVGAAAIDVAAVGDACLRAATMRGHLAVLELLLADDRVEPAVKAKSEAAALKLRSKEAAAAKDAALAEAELRNDARQHEVDEAAVQAAAAAAPTVLTQRKRSPAAAGGSWLTSLLTGANDSASSGSGSDSAHDSLRDSFVAALEVGDVGGLKAALAHPLLDPQEPLRGGGVAPSCEQRFLGTQGTTALAEAARHASAQTPAASRLAVLEVLLADPCWEPLSVTGALHHACRVGSAPVVERLLADPRCELSTLPHDASGALPAGMSGPPGPPMMTIFDEVAFNGSARVLSLLVAEGRRRGISPAAMGRRIEVGLRQWKEVGDDGAEGTTRAGALLCDGPSTLRACMASLAATETAMPDFMRRLIDLSAIGAAAWFRRRHVVAARARMLACLDEDDDDDDDGGRTNGSGSDGGGADAKGWCVIA